MNEADWRRAVVGGLLAVAAFVMYTATLAPGLTWVHDGADGGDLARAAVLGSIPHPTGYPAYLLLARLFLLLPLRDPAFRLNLMSAACTAAAIGLLGAWLTRPRGGDRVAGYVAGVTGALSLASAPLIWSQAVITEVYGLHLLCAVAFLVAWSAWHRSNRAGMAGLAGLAAGIGLGNHVTLVFLAPLLAVTAIDSQTPRRHWLRFLAGFASGLAVYLYLPLVELMGEPSPWGRLDTLSAWAAYVTGEPYRSYLFTVPVADVLGRLLAVLGTAWNDFAPWGIALAVLGAWSAWWNARRETIALGACALFSITFSIGYNTTDAFRYLIVAWLMFAIWIGEGGRALAAATRQSAALGVVAFVAWLAVTGFTFATRWDSIDASNDTTAVTITERTLAGLPRDTVLITRTDRQTFALWYYIDAVHVRPDVLAVDQDLFTYAPYRAYLTSRWHNPSTTSDSLADWLGALGDRPLYYLDAGGGIRTVNARDLDSRWR